MKTYNNLYSNLCSLDNLEKAFINAKKRKTTKSYVIEFEKNLNEELLKLKQELETLAYQPRPLKGFIIRDPKTRKIHASAFRDRVVHHAIINILEPIFEKIFICDSYASRVNKGTHNALIRFDKFKRKISNNGSPINNYYNNNSVEGYVLKADIKHYFETVDHEILLSIIKRKISDEKVIWLIKQILNNFDSKIDKIGMPLGNLTSQFFANIYLNELDYFVKHKLKTKYYIRYVDDFVILHKQKEVLEHYKQEIDNYLRTCLKIELHPDKSKIIPLSKGISFVGYRIFYHYKLLRKRNIKKFETNFNEKLELFNDDVISKDEFIESLRGWFGYAMWANTYKFRSKVINNINSGSNKHL